MLSSWQNLCKTSPSSSDECTALQCQVATNPQINPTNLKREQTHRLLSSTPIQQYQPSILPGSVNEYQLQLERQRQVRFISLTDVHKVCRKNSWERVQYLSALEVWSQQIYTYLSLYLLPGLQLEGCVNLNTTVMAYSVQPMPEAVYCSFYHKQTTMPMAGFDPGTSHTHSVGQLRTRPLRPVTSIQQPLSVAVLPKFWPSFGLHKAVNSEQYRSAYVHIICCNIRTYCAI